MKNKMTSNEKIWNKHKQEIINEIVEILHTRRIFGDISHPHYVYWADRYENPEECINQHYIEVLKTFDSTLDDTTIKCPDSNLFCLCIHAWTKKYYSQKCKYRDCEWCHYENDDDDGDDDWCRRRNDDY